MCVRTTLPAAGDGDLIHDAARRADDVVLGHLAEPRDARRRKFQTEIRVEATQRADFHRRRTADAHVHRHGAQQEQIEAVGQLHRFFLEQRENAADDVSRPVGERIGLAERADFRIAGQTVAGLEIVERDARFDGQRLDARLHGADAQRAVGARLQPHQHAAAQHGFADVRAGVIRDAAHDIEPGGDARDPDFAGGEKARQAGGITVGLLQELFEFRNFKREFGVHFQKCSGHVPPTLPKNFPEVTPEKSMVMMPELS